MRDEANVREVEALGISMMGFIFYPPSPRFVSGIAPLTHSGIERVGVFVNSTAEHIIQMVKLHNLSYVQLHGAESVDLCRSLRTAGLGVIKAISVSSREDISQATKYDGEVDFLLFDTKCSDFGGSGVRFDWSILNSYTGGTPFLLSGGIDSSSASDIAALDHPQFAGVDLNSRFENSPALKNIDKLKTFIEQL